MHNRSIPLRSVLSDREMEMGPDTVIKKLAHWYLKQDDDGIAWLILDRAEETANTLSEDVMEELDAILTTVEGMGAKGLVLRSAKKGGFVAGADIRDFRGVTSKDEIAARMRRAHDIADRLTALSIPTIAVIHGHCLGGGLELALACRYRIAIHGAKLGLPEVLLGLHPGLGGTFRLPSLINPVEAMTMMLTGKTVHSAKAKRIGLVDAAIEERHVKNAIRAAVSGDLKRLKRPWWTGVFRLAPVRRILGKRMRAQAEKQAPSKHYPAPYKLISLWEQHGGNDKKMQAEEIKSFSILLSSETAQNLIRVFFLRERLKSFGKGHNPAIHVHVIGAGVMGGDIAAWCAARGLMVTISDLDQKMLARTIRRASAFYDKKLHSSIERRDALDRLIPDFAGDGVSHADIVIEAIAENVEAKKKLYAAVAPRMKEGALLATNSSSIDLETLRSGLPDPSRFVGIHFFNPVTRMELVEIISHDTVNGETLSLARAFCNGIDRLPAPVKSSPGFLVNRALTPYLMEAFLMLDEGTAKETVDRAAKDFGMPMGPIELADQVGLDIGLHVADSLKQALPDPMPDIPTWLRQKVEKGDLGRKTGKGLYDYDDKGKPIKNTNAPAPTEDMTDRLILPMLNTCVGLLREGIVDDTDTLDGAMIFATGFPPFHGGPIHYARKRGTDDIVAALKRFEGIHGSRFAPDDGWRRLAEF